MRNSVCHSATIYANAIMHAGTTVDTFLRENLVSHTSLFYIYIYIFLCFGICMSVCRFFLHPHNLCSTIFGLHIMSGLVEQGDKLGQI
jgi:hypothetical protein